MALGWSRGPTCRLKVVRTRTLGERRPRTHAAASPCGSRGEALALRMASKGRAYRTVEVEGFEVLVGKAASDNDYLTFKVAKPQDLWLHVNGVPGSHVVVRNPDMLSALPKPVIERAAEFAAYYSKAREARGKVEVHVCWASDVRKERGSPAGEVQLRRWDRVKVYPRALEEEADDA